MGYSNHKPFMSICLKIVKRKACMRNRKSYKKVMASSLTQKFHYRTILVTVENYHRKKRQN